MNNSIGVRALCMAIMFAGITAPSIVWSQQIDADYLQSYVSSARGKEIQLWYQLRNNRCSWLTDTSSQNDLVRLLRLSNAYGLQQNDYQYEFLKDYQPGVPLPSRSDSMRADILFTDAAIHFFCDLRFGNAPPAFGYEGFSVPADKGEVVRLLLNHFSRDNLSSLFHLVQPVSIEYRRTLQQHNWLLSRLMQPAFEDVKVRPSKSDTIQTELLLRLYQLGLTDTLLKSPNAKQIASAVKEAQARFGLNADGKAGTATCRALNVPLLKRMVQTARLLNIIRWLDILKSEGVAIVNIPAARLLVYDSGKCRLDSRLIVGKPSTPTPTLTSFINEVILYPYWMVPKKIATKELLPRIRRNIGYLETHGYQVLNDNGTVVNPYNVRWWGVNQDYFPYTIRQSTGCDNSLGIIKFNFYNPFTVYLHDTNKKELFTEDQRFFSHGCMRVEKPVAFAHLLLGSNRAAIDTVTAKGCLLHQKPQVLTDVRKLKVVVLYSTAWHNPKGDTFWYDDVYGRDNDD